MHSFKSAEVKRQLEFEWDESNLKKIRKHLVSKEEVEQVFYNDPVELEEEFHDESEEYRERLIGRTDDDRVLFVVWTERGQKVRVITAFEATGGLLRAYEEEWT